MNIFNRNLRTKSMLALVVACLVALAPMIFIGWQVLERGKAHFGRAYAENFTLLKAQKIKEPVSRELALAQRFADSVLLLRWLKDPDSAGTRSSFFQEADGYQEAFQGGNYFVVNRETLAYYFNGPDKAYSQEPRYSLDPDKAEDSWFFSTIEEFDTHTINVNPDVHLGNVQVWINVMIWNKGRKIGMAGTGLELSDFLQEFIAVEEPGVTPMILDSKGLIQAHPDERLIAYGSGAEADKQKTSGQDQAFSLQKQLSGSDQAQRLERAMQRARKNPGKVQTFWAGLNGKKQLLALTWIPELNWNVVTAVDLQAVQVLEGARVSMAVAALVVMLVLLLLLFSYGVDRIVLRPLNKLHQSATALARGEYDVSLPSAGPDELGDLTRAFSGMVKEIKSHTRELEDKVRERTCELEEKSTQLEQAKEKAEEASQAKTEVLDKVMESIHYAQTIQQAILTGEEQLRALVPESFCLWRPKDVISGDMVWSRRHRDGFALAVLDCTGHGVPGGVMTMAAVSALDRVASATGIDDPARVQQEVSRVVQKMLSNQDASRFSEDGLDMGLCVYCHSTRSLVFAGSRLSLFYGHNGQLAEIKGDRQSLGYRSSDPDFPFQTHTVDVQEKMVFYLATDGLFDQIGQETGLPLGKKRLRSFLSSLGEKPMQDQKTALLEIFEKHQGDEEQRDDVTVLGFHPAP
ncbi:biofilm regulation protein phosphatase SiaA [Candidatus Electrothrix sp.]|uniref:biofilm regulation protein phosphatase SiaA n=1 Tax=Candidatus Electrothrix sp. TaxID=2170559 RepID=UPI00405728CB